MEKHKRLSFPRVVVPLNDGRNMTANNVRDRNIVFAMKNLVKLELLYSESSRCTRVSKNFENG